VPAQLTATPTADVLGRRRAWADSSVEDVAAVPLSRAQAQALRQELASISPWRVIAAQLAVGLMCGAVVWLVWQELSMLWSSLYGMAAVVLPGVLLARGLTRGTASPLASAAGFLFWEMLKIAVAIAMLVIASRVVPQLSWPALLATMVVCTKVNWLALLWRKR
jgi:ATP synthase protein I